MPPINVAYWAARYDANADDADTYDEVLTEYTELVERCRRLWNWKDLSRGVPFENVEPVLESIEIADFLSDDPGVAVERLGDELVAQGAMQNRTTVTPAFILHLADSQPDAYSTRFPIFDVRCWISFAYLDGRRTGDDRLPASATTSPSKYGDYVQFFQRTKPDAVSGRTYEWAIFQFGGYLSALPFETIEKIDDHIQLVEEAVEESVTENGFALVDR